MATKLASVISKSQRIRAEIALDEWVKESMDEGASVMEIERMLVEKLQVIIKGVCVAEIEQSKYEESQFSKCCEYLKRNFDINVSVSDIKNHVKNEHILSDIVSGAYRNTHVIEEIADILSNAIVGMCMPCYGESKSIVAKFQKVAKEKGFID